MSDTQPPYTDAKFPAMQRMAIKALSASYAENVHATLFAEIEVGALLERLEKSDAPTLTGSIIHAVATSVSRYPNFNSIYADGQKRTYSQVDIGFAVAGNDGSLSVPVIRNADRLTTSEIDKLRRDLAERARAKKLRQEEFGGAAMTVSNIGMFSNIRHGTPIIPAGQGALLAIGAVHWGFDGEGNPTKMLPVSFGFDHRVNNGAPAAQFLETFAMAL